MQMFSAVFQTDTSTWNRRSDRHFPLRLNARCYEEIGREICVCVRVCVCVWGGGVDGLERTTKAEASKIKRKSFFFCFYGSERSPILSICQPCTSPKQTNMFVHSAVCLQDKRAFTAVYNYTDLIVIIIK